ncbi:hypothetical protein D3C86_1891330 [compost metagenome]
MDLLAQPPLRTNAEAVADQQHADQQFRIDRRSADGAVERRQMRPQAVQFHETINRAQHVIRRHMPL